MIYKCLLFEREEEMKMKAKESRMLRNVAQR